MTARPVLWWSRWHAVRGGSFPGCLREIGREVAEQSHTLQVLLMGVCVTGKSAAVIGAGVVLPVVRLPDET